jgi:4-amino-4-deoxy-L-arabinose transferase-like glycosyltransferase
MYGGDLNPHVFNYPAFFMLTITAVTLALTTTGMLAADVATTIYRIARYLSAAAGIAGVLMIFRIGRRLFGQTTALAAAALLSLAFLHVRDSHFGVTDVPMTFMVLVAFLFIVRLSESGETRDLIAAGVAAGLATSTSHNAALIARLRCSSSSRMPSARRGQDSRSCAALHCSSR